MHINEFHHLKKDEGESFQIRFDGSPHVNPNAQLPERMLIIHAPAAGSVAGAVSTLKQKPDKSGFLPRSTHLVVGRDGGEIVQMVPFQIGSNNALYPYNKQSIGIDLEYSGELKAGSGSCILASGIGNSRYGYWPLYPKEQLDSLLLIARTIVHHNHNQYHITDVVARDEILSSSHPGPAFPILQFREKVLGVTDRSILLQETSRSVRLLGDPENQNTQLSPIPLPAGTPVCVINERFDWYLVSVNAEVGGNPWLIGWVEKEAVRVKTDFVAEINEQHYLTADGRRFQEIKPHPNGYEHNRKNPSPEFIIMHYTTGTRMESTINHFKDPGSFVSTHLLIGRDGRVVQFLPFDHIAHHSGYSWWEQRKNLNNFSIGIELDNAGMLIRKNNQWQRHKIFVPDADVKQAIHKHQYLLDEAKFPGWQTFTDIQLKVAFKIVEALVKKYKIKEILGHDDVNIHNRYDPGPLFEETMKEWRRTLLGREEPIVGEYLINHTTEIYGNFQGRLPNPSQKTFDVSLPANSVVKVVRQDGEFSLVTVLQTKDPKAKGTGWIKTAALTEGPKKAGHKKNKDKETTGKTGAKKQDLEDKRRTKVPQMLFRRGENSPTPRLAEGPFEVGTRVRIQERRGEWTLVVLLDRYKKQGGLEGWMPTEFLSPREEMPVPFAVADAQTVSLPLWQHKDDMGALNKIRTCAPCPAVFTLHESRVDVTREWQFFIRAINPGMSLQHVAALFGPTLAFTNRHPSDLRADHLQGANLNCPDPDFDKVRTCSLSVMTGVVEGEMLRVETMDGSQPPPLKPGRNQPQRVEEINPDDYLYTPQTHRHLFFAANIVRPNGQIIPFPHGAVYPWTHDGQAYVWLPHVSRFPVSYPLGRLMRLPAGAPIPSPYR